LSRFCHPDEASDASGRKWLLASGQRRERAAGTGFGLLPSNLKGRCAISETGTGFACAKLSEVRSSRR